MIRKLTALAAAVAFALTTLAPVEADAQGRRHYRDRDHRGHYSYDHRRHHRDRHDHDDAVAAGVIGLVLGLAIGAAVSEGNNNRDRGCYDDNYRRPCPREGYYREGGDPDPRYDSRSAYERDYGRAPPDEAYYDPPPAEQCTRAERQWDRYANRYVMVDVPC